MTRRFETDRHARGERCIGLYFPVHLTRVWSTMKFLSLGATWFRRGLQSSAGHTEGWLPRKYTQKSITANDNSYALAA